MVNNGGDWLSNKNEDEERGKMTVQEAGRRGGEKTAQTYGKAFYKEIGKRGGEVLAESRGYTFYSKIGKKGGQRVRDLVEAGKEHEQE